MTKRTCLIIIAAFCAIVSCKTDQTGLPTPSSNKAIVGTWFLKEEIVGGIIQGFVSTPDTIKGYTTSDYYKFNANNQVYVSTSGSLKPDTVNYSFNSTPTSQTLVVGGFTSTGFTTYSVNKLSVDSLILFNTVTATSQGVTITTNTTSFYAHQ
jgi:hypothetical protein